MVQTIGNPLSWVAKVFGGGAQGISSGVHELGGADDGQVQIRDIDFDSLKLALGKGRDDFLALRTDVIFIVLIYPVVGILLTWFALNNEVLYLLFPLISGFALLGPVAAVGLYEMSRRREQGAKAGWGDGFRVMTSPSIFPILALGGFLAAVFLAWMICAHFIYGLTLGPDAPASSLSFLRDVFTTSSGWVMIIAGGAVGFVFAAVVLAVSLVSFPLLVDRSVGVPVAVVTSVNIAKRNPKTVAAWGAIVVSLLALGVLTLFVGLIFVLPLLGHATWHLYRQAVVPQTEARDAT
ncbi:DUF2189 domain-containing protein [Roseobacter sp. YSTF-M11]|uniref:DUF2189 domain-containing protein n=1 Tax=Roseobacter insulae TaxID=2859783 RepID=A0A9X1FSR9_9RHOB|nr:DUF2189 domain-containing protein [Roseobacter insulae]MBW4707028.1 DUF2189 domain-containing protein [Roseobacter insulae]